MTIQTLGAYPMPDPTRFPAGRLNWPLKVERAALLVHDLQLYFLAFYGDGNPLIQQMLRNIGALCFWAREQGVPVIYTAQPRQQSRHERGLLTDAWGAGLTAVNKEQQSICPEVMPQPGDQMLTKWRYSAFQRTPLADVLEEHDRDELLICGVYSHIGCHATALEAFMRDIKPFFVADAQADFSESDHQRALELVANTCGRLIDTRSVLASRLEQQ